MNQIHLSFQKLSNGNYFSYIDRMYVRTGCMVVCTDSSDMSLFVGGIKIFT